jgi:hypothetical protein
MSYFSYNKEDLPKFIKETIVEIKQYDKEKYPRKISYQSVLDFLNWVYDEEDMQIGGW